MTTKTKSRHFGGTSPYALGARLGAPLMNRGAMVAFAPDEPGASDPPAEPETVDKAAHDRLVAAHERLKKDAKDDRDALKALKEQMDTLQAERDAAAEEAAHKSGDVETIKAQLEEKHAKELKKANERADKAEGQVRKLVIEAGINEALDEARVKPELRKAAAALLREGVEIKEEDGNPVAIKAGLPIAEAIKVWAESDEGKHFILDGNSGGGAGGGRGGTAPNNPWKSGPTFSLTEQDRIQAKDPALASRLKAEAGVA